MNVIMNLKENHINRMGMIYVKVAMTNLSASVIIVGILSEMLTLQLLGTKIGARIAIMIIGIHAQDALIMCMLTR